MHGLTARQLQVARMISDGLTNIEIAERLGISASAVKQHSDVVRRKLGVLHRRHIGPEARRRGLI